MNATANPQIFSGRQTGLTTALMLNFLWINVSEVWRYFAIIRPLLLETFPGQAGIAPVTLPIALSWALWDGLLILAATQYYAMHLRAYGHSGLQVVLSATAFTITVFGLLWLAVVNMGLAPSLFLWRALPLAWLEQVIAALITLWAMRPKSP